MACVVRPAKKICRTIEGNVNLRVIRVISCHSAGGGASNATTSRCDTPRRVSQKASEPCQIWCAHPPYLARRPPTFRTASDGARRETPIPPITRLRRALRSPRTPNFVRSPSDPHHAMRNRPRARYRPPKIPRKGNPKRYSQKWVSVNALFLRTILF